MERGLVAQTSVCERRVAFSGGEKSPFVIGHLTFLIFHLEKPSRHNVK